MKCTSLVMLIALQGFLGSANAGAITTEEIVGHTTDAIPACLNWRPIGVCLWLICTSFGCSVETSVKVSHAIPDLVVPVYNDPAEYPWKEMGGILSEAQQGALSGIIGQLAGGVLIGSSGQRTETQVDNDRPGDRQRNASFRETDVIGHPTLASDEITAAIDGGDETSGGLVCPSPITPLLPYFQSSLDALVWRNFVPVELAYLASSLPGLREIGSWPLNTWGHVHPRTGFMDHLVEPKAAATNAQRAGDIVTREAQPHIYLPTPQGIQVMETMWVWMPPPLEEMNEETGTWQMLVPQPETECQVFGENDTVSIFGWASNRVDERGDYVWNLWRPYKCCEIKGIFLTDIEFSP